MENDSTDSTITNISSSWLYLLTSLSNHSTLVLFFLISRIQSEKTSKSSLCKLPLVLFFNTNVSNRSFENEKPNSTPAKTQTYSTISRLALVSNPKTWKVWWTCPFPFSPPRAPSLEPKSYTHIHTRQWINPF